MSVVAFNARTDVRGYVLAGGRSVRMGQDKAFLEYGNEPLVARALRRLKLVCAETAILSGPVNAPRDALLSRYGRTIPDREVQHEGPLAGVYAALLDCAAPFALIVAVDQPDVSPAGLATLCEIAVEKQAGAVYLSAGEKPEPLPFVIASALHAAVAAALSSGERRLLPGVRMASQSAGLPVLALPVQEAERESLINLNTPEEFLNRVGRVLR